MRYVTVLVLGCAACRPHAAARAPAHVAAPHLKALILPDSGDSTLRVPRVVTAPSVVVFWLKAADTLDSEDLRQTFDDLRYYTEQVAPTLDANGIQLVATSADTVYVELPDKRRRTILLSGLDYPFGYLLIDPGGPERILTGVYADDELMDELRAYFDLPDDSTTTQPRITT